MTEQEQKSFDLMREALEEIICAHPVTSTMRQVHAIVAGRAALTAANDVSVEKPKRPEGVTVEDCTFQDTVGPVGITITNAVQQK